MKKLALAALAITLVLNGCATNKEQANEIVVYTAIEQSFVEDIFKDFEESTGITVKAVYDTEATKTTGLVNRIITEKEKPVCDVFWNNEFVQTIDLKNKSLLDSYKPINIKDVPDAFKDPDGYWTALGGRARVMLVNTDLVNKNDFPNSIYDLLDDNKFNGSEVAIALPMFGTTKTHAAALYALLGDEEARNIFESFKNRGVQVVDGNSVTKDMAVAGKVKVGYTDTDDAKEGIESGGHVEIVYPDQDGIGTLVTPSTIALIANAPNSENAKKFIDYIVSKDIENRMIESGFFDTALMSENEYSIKTMDVNLNDVYSKLEIATDDMEEIFNN